MEYNQELACHPVLDADRVTSAKEQKNLDNFFGFTVEIQLMQPPPLIHFSALSANKEFVT